MMAMNRWVLTLLIFNLLNLTITAKKPSGECIPIGDESSNPDISSKFHCVASKAGVACIDEDPQCQEWAGRGECKKNPQYMLYNCRKACETCVSLHVGVTQTSPNTNHVNDVLNVMQDTQQYIYDKAAVRPGVLSSCKNDHSMCSYWASRGECNSNPGYMHEGCQPACRNCR